VYPFSATAFRIGSPSPSEEKSTTATLGTGSAATAWGLATADAVPDRGAD
jgi:hypothetical protein